MTLDDGDRLLLRALADDGRTGLADLAAATRWSRSTAHRRMTELTAGGALYFDIDVDQRLFPAIAAWTLLWLPVEPAALDTVGNALAEHPRSATPRPPPTRPASTPAWRVPARRRRTRI